MNNNIINIYLLIAINFSKDSVLFMFFLHVAIVFIR